MPGTQSNPVKLDHYQNIIEVGWPQFSHVALAIGVGVSPLGSAVLPGAGIVCDPFDNTPASLAGTYAPTIRYSSGVETRIYRYRKSTLFDGIDSDYEVDGADDEVDNVTNEGFGVFGASVVVAGGSGDFQDPRTIDGAWDWIDASGSSLGISGPSGVGDFQGLLSRTFRTQLYATGASQCVFGIPDNLTSLHIGALYQNSSKTYDVSGVTVRLLLPGGVKSFRAIGSTIGEDNKLWVLCARA